MYFCQECETSSVGTNDDGRESWFWRDGEGPYCWHCTHRVPLTKSERRALLDVWFRSPEALDHAGVLVVEPARVP